MRLQTKLKLATFATVIVVSGSVSSFAMAPQNALLSQQIGANQRGQLFARIFKLSGVETPRTTDGPLFIVPRDSTCSPSQVDSLNAITNPSDAKRYVDRHTVIGEFAINDVPNQPFLVNFFTNAGMPNQTR